MKSEPLITISIVTYNHEKYIGACIQSVLDQTYSNLQIIIVDDHSTDNTVEIIKSFCDPRIELITKEVNRGVSDSTKRYLDQAKGDYIVTLCGDDVCAITTKLERQLAFLETNARYNAVFSDVNFINEKGELILKEEYSSFAKKVYRAFRKGIELNDNRHNLLKCFFIPENVICGPSGMFDMRVFRDLGCFDLRYEFMQDFDMWVRMLVKNYEFYVLDEKLLNYRIRDNGQNLSAPNEGKYNRYVYELSKIMEGFWELSLMDFIKAFPDYSIPGQADEELVPFYLAQIKTDSLVPQDRLFVANTLHMLYDSRGKNLAEKIEKNTGFTLRDYYHVLSQVPFNNLVQVQKKEKKKKRSLKQKLVGIITGRSRPK